jgi:uncharacterized RDD family membrane protein YckC
MSATPGPASDIPPPAPFDQPGFESASPLPEPALPPAEGGGPSMEAGSAPLPPLSGDPGSGAPTSFDSPTPPAAAPPSGFDQPVQPAAPPPDPAHLVQELRQSSADLLPTLDDITSSIAPPEARPPVPVYDPNSAFAHTSTGASPAIEAGQGAGFGIRLAAALLDGILIGGLAFAAFLVTDSQSVAGGVQLLGSLGIFVAWALAGTSPGKKALGLEIRNQEGESRLGFLRAAIRVAGYLLCCLTLGIGFLMIAFSKERRGLHDRIAGTWVERA